MEQYRRTNCLGGELGEALLRVSSEIGLITPDGALEFAQDIKYVPEMSYTALKFDSTLQGKNQQERPLTNCDFINGNMTAYHWTRDKNTLPINKSKLHSIAYILRPQL